MKEEALELVREESDPGKGLNLLREYLQAYTLRVLHDAEAFNSLAFVGGTALRFLHGLPRFSEDLDFSLETGHGYDGLAWMRKIKRELELSGFEVEVVWNERSVVHSGWIRLEGLLYEAGLSPIKKQKLSIKIEIDTRPPAGAVMDRRLVTRHLTFLLRYHDLPSLMAGKLHALLARPYVKGRDWYDFVWYRSQRPPVAPNRILLQNALQQTPATQGFRVDNWALDLQHKIESLDTEKIIQDVGPFLERPGDAQLLTRENLLGLLPEI